LSGRPLPLFFTDSKFIERLTDLFNNVAQRLCRLEVTGNQLWEEYTTRVYTGTSLLRAFYRLYVCSNNFSYTCSNRR